MSNYLVKRVGQTFPSGRVNITVPLSPAELPNSIVIMDNAKIHMCEKLESAIHQTGALLLFLLPYAPQLNPIEACFGCFKA